MSKYSYDELIDAGAPELPDGYFYRIGPGPFHGSTRIQIRKRCRFGSVEVTSFDGFPQNHEALISYVNRTYETVKIRFADRTEVTRFYGDHP